MPPIQLDIEMAHPEHPHRCLAHGGKGFGQNVIELGAIIHKAPQLGGLGFPPQFIVRQRLELRLQSIDLVDNLAKRFERSDRWSSRRRT